MGLGIFRKPYVIRRHGEQTIKNGLASAPYTDVVMRLNVQPPKPNDFDGREEGDVTVKNLKSWGANQLNSADENTETPGDLLFYQGRWYECTSSVMWNHTPLRHFQSDFVLLPTEKQYPPPKPPEPPTPEPESGVTEE